MGCNDFYYDAAREAKRTEIDWRLKNDFESAFYLQFGNHVWTCLKCFSLVLDERCRQHREVCK